MNSTYTHRLSQAWFAIQDGLFPEIEVRVAPSLARIERQLQTTALTKMLSDLPRDCDTGTKQDSARLYYRQTIGNLMKPL